MKHAVGISLTSWSKRTYTYWHFQKNFILSPGVSISETKMFMMG